MASARPAGRRFGHRTTCSRLEKAGGGKVDPDQVCSGGVRLRQWGGDVHEQGDLGALEDSPGAIPRSAPLVGTARSAAERSRCLDLLELDHGKGDDMRRLKHACPRPLLNAAIDSLAREMLPSLAGLITLQLPGHRQTSSPRSARARPGPKRPDAHAPA